MIIDTTEIAQTLDHLQRTFEDLMLRGLKAAGPGEVNTLSNIREECERIGAYHLASRVEDILTAIQKNDRSGAAAVMRAQTSLRLFDRILTLETAQRILERSINLSDDDWNDENDENDDAENGGGASEELRALAEIDAKEFDDPANEAERK